jgi:hypothetical protein
MSPTTQSPDTGGPSAQRDGSHDDPERPFAPHPPPADAIHEAFARLTELKEFVSYYVAARVDAWKTTLRNVGIYAVGAALFSTALVLLLVGIAGAFAQIFSGHPWLGDIITSVIFLGFLGGSVFIGMKILRKTFHNMTVEKYESRQSHQREQFGHSVRDEAERAGRAKP